MKLQRRTSILIIVTLLFAVMFTGQAFADEIMSSPVSGALTGDITQVEIQQGLEFCAEYPAVLEYDGRVIEFPDTLCPPTIIRSRTLIPARQLFETMGGVVQWDPGTQQVEVSLDDSVVSLTIGSDKALVNGTEKDLDVPALIIDHDGDYYGSTMIPLRFVSEELGYTVLWDDVDRTANVMKPGDLPQLSETAKTKIICIDPGHGGEDPGAIGHEDQTDEIYESDINLNVALKLKELLEASGAKVVMTRESDTKVDKYERATIANEAGAQIFVSIHNNSSDTSRTNGTATYYYNKAVEDGTMVSELYGISSESLAEAVQEALSPVLGTKDSGTVSYPELAVLNKTNMPAIVVEGAYLSNESDFALISNEGYADDYAYGVASGLISAMNEAWK